MMLKTNFRAALLASAVSLAAGSALAQTAAPAAAPAPAPVTLLGPPMTQPLALNTTAPVSVDVGPLGKWYVGGALTGLGFVGTEATNTSGGIGNTADNGGGVDISNAQVFIQKTDGFLQFYAQVGLYSYPALGTPYYSGAKWTDNTYGPVPVAFVKLVPTDNFSISAGKLITLIGDEYTWSFENFNIARGVLTNIEPGVGRGVQANLVEGPLSFAVQFSDGFYSNVFNTLTGNVTWTIDSSNILAVTAGGTLGTNNAASFATPVVQNNQTIVDVIYTYIDGPLTVTPMFQYTTVSKNDKVGYDTGDTWGISLLANYNIDDHWSLGARAEYLAGSGDKDSLTDPNLTFYGPGSKAYTFTLTPTYKIDKYFIRGEVSYIGLSDFTPGLGFGEAYDKSGQFRAMLETGVLF